MSSLRIRSKSRSSTKGGDGFYTNIRKYNVPQPPKKRPRRKKRPYQDPDTVVSIYDMNVVRMILDYNPRMSLRDAKRYSLTWEEFYGREQR